MRRFAWALILVVASTVPAYASSGGDPVASIAVVLAIVLTSAKVFGHLAELAGQPSVLGELVAGVVLGILGRAYFPSIDLAAKSPELTLLAGLGVLLLLFEVGLESTVGQMVEIGGPALRVAVAGVIAPTLLGAFVATLLLPNASIYTHAFIGATLCATSVGITARVLKDLGRSQTTEARLILGAAVIDDVLGLIVLAVVAGAIGAAGSGQPLSVLNVALIALKAIAFLGGALWLGTRVAPPLFRGASHLRSGGALLATGLIFCFGLSWLAAAFGLAPIVGAFAAGLILEETHFNAFLQRGEAGLETQVHPIAGFLAPVFFVQMGMMTDVAQLFDRRIALLGLSLTFAGIIGKVVAGYALPRKGESMDRIAVGLGMVPRGEVGLIFANVGMGLHIAGAAVVDRKTYAAIVMMVILTTLVTPPALKWRFGRDPS